MQRKKNRKRQQEKRTAINNRKKLEKLKKIRTNVQYDSRGKRKNNKPNLISNIGKNADFGQRAAKLKQSMGGIGSMKYYKKTEQKAFKEAEKYQKKKKKEADKKNKLKINGAKKPVRKTGRAALEAKNRAKFGDARIDKLKAKTRDFQAMKKGKMTKAQFIEKYANSQTAKKNRKK